MKKDFDKWNEKKKLVNSREDRLYFKEGDIWWVNLGINIGFETDGKGEGFERPVLIIKKYNKYSFLAIPLSTSKKRNDYLVSLGEVDNKEAIAVLSQMRNIDSKRLINKIGFVSEVLLGEVKKKAIEQNLK